MTLSLFLTFDVESNRPGNYITCDHVPGAPGLFWIMDELERHGARGVFFVNVYEHTRYASGWMQDILRQIHERGHEVGLHCHQNPDLDFYRRSLTSYDLEGQTKIILYGVEFIEAATGLRPVSFRSGALRVNDDTFRALEACQLPLDSSLLYSTTNNNDVSAYRSINKAALYGTVREFPITFVTRYRPDRSPRSARLDPNVTPDTRGLIAAVEQMIAAGCDHAILIGHSFSFLLCTYDQSSGLPGVGIFKKGKQKYVMGVDEFIRSTFVDFLDFVESRRPAVRTLLFRDLPGVDETTVPGPDFVPQVPDNGLIAWPTAKDYAKREKRGDATTSMTYRRRPTDVLLHVGTWKTGSKALQKFWALNRDELRRRGIFYPLSPSAPYMQGGNRSYQSRIATGGDPDRRPRLQALAAEITAQADDTVLVSHENICNLSITELLEFVACLAGCRFKPVLYLRRQDHYAASLYNQHVKAGVAFPGSFEEHFEHYRSRYDYRQMVQRLGTVFGLENIIVRPYEKDAFFGGSIFSDFGHHVLGMAIDESFVMPKRDQNSRLDCDALEFKRIVNSLEGTKEEILSLGKYLIDYCEAQDPSIREAFQEHNLLSTEQRQRILDDFAEGNGWVAREMLHRSDGVLFYEPMPSEQKSWMAYPGLSEQKAVEIAFHVYRNMLRELERRDVEIERLNGSRRLATTSAGPRSTRDWLRLARSLKKLWRWQFRERRTPASRLRIGPKPKASSPKWG